MRILFIYRHFWPDTPPYASMLRSMGGHMVDAGHDVTLWCEMPTYGRINSSPRRDEVVDGIHVTRMRSLPFWRRSRGVAVMGKVLFPLRVLLRAVAMKLSGDTYDLVVSATAPPVINGFFTLLTARVFGARFIYHCQDIYPELGAIAGIWKSDGWFFRALARLDLWTCRRAHQVIVLSEDMLTTMEARGLQRRNLAVVNNFMVPDFSAIPKRPVAKENSFQVIFAGNLGRFQGLDKVLDAAEELQANGNIHFLFLGDGAELEHLKRRGQALSNVKFARALPLAQAWPAVAGASLGIVSLQPGVIRGAYPSKTLTYLGLGVPVLAIVERGCELARMIESEGVGYVTGSNDRAAVADAIIRGYENRQNIAAMRARAKDLYARRFSRADALRRWECLIEGSA